MSGNDVVKTEVIISDESVHKIVVAETGKALASIPGLMEKFVNDVLFFRPPKRNSYDDERPTFYEDILQSTIKPMIEEEVKKVATVYRNELSAIIKRAFKTNVLDNAEFENRLIEKLAKFTSNINFYVDN